MAQAWLPWASACTHNPDPATLEEDTCVADALLKLCMNLVGARVQSLMMYSHSLPGMFAAPLAGEDAVVKATLGKLHLVWKWLQAAERDAITKGGVQKHLDRLRWRRWVWIREVLIQLYEVEFQYVPLEVRGALQDLFQGLLHTKMVEDAFKHLKGMARSNERGQLQRKSRWSALRTSRLLSENDRPGVQLPAAMASVAAALPQTVFNADQQDFSLGMDVLHALADPAWSSQSPATSSMQAMFLQCCLALQAWDLVEKAWVSLLAAPGDILVERERSTTPLMVVSTCQWGCVLWPMAHRSRGGYKYFTFKELKDGESWELAHITDIKAWRGIRVKANPPVGHGGHAAPNSAPGGVLLRPVAQAGAKAEGLLQLSASRCFKGLTVPRLSALYDMLDVCPGMKKPKLEKDLCRALLNHALPDLGDTGVEELLGKRFDAAASSNTLDARSVLASAANQEAIQGLIDEDEIEKELTNYVEQKLGTKLKRTSGTASAPAMPAAASTASSSSGQTLPQAAKISLKDAKRFVPPGSTLELDLKRHMRWKVIYKEKESAPFSHTGTFGEAEASDTQRSALLACLRWAWAAHTLRTKEVCPWDLSG
jgi:hypothetical protein